MADYGGYETIEEFHRGALTTVWKARPAGASTDEIFAVKVCRPAEWAAEEEGASTLIAAMAESVADLNTLQAAGSDRWAPVLASGHNDEEGYWVTRFYPRSLERIIEGRAQLASEDLQWVAANIGRALADLEQRLSRPHGNLKPGNVFIDGEGRVVGAPIILSDPKPRSQLDADVDRTADFHALGRMLVHLARRQHANLQAAIGWPLEAGPEWRRLGPAGELWRELCNLLLNPDPAAGEQNWVMVDLRLLQIAKRRRSPRKMVLAYAGLGVGVAGLVTGGLALRFSKYETLPESLKPWAVAIGNVPERAREVPGEWAELCGFYDNWLGEFMAVTRDAKRIDEWKKHPEFTDKVLAPLLAFGSFDPHVLAKVSGDLATLAAQPPDAVKDGVVVDKLRTAHARIAAASQAFKNWEDRRRIEELAGQFVERGWAKPAEELRRVLDAALLPDAVPEIPCLLSPKNIDDILRLGPAAASTGARWKELERRCDLLAAGDDPVMRGLKDYLSARVTSAADLDTVNRALADATSDTERWLSWVQGNNGQPAFDRAAFARESSLAGFSGAVTPQVLARWEEEVRDKFAFVPDKEDPRKNADAWSALERSIDATIASIREEERSSGGETAEAAPLTASRNAIHARAESLRTGALTRRDLPKVAADVDRITQDLTKLAGLATEAYGRVSPKAADWLAAVRASGAKFGPESSPLRLEWVKRRDQLVPASVTVRSLEENKRTFNGLRKNYADLDRFFSELAGPRGVGALATLATAGIADDLAADLKTWAGGRTERTIGQWLQLARWSNHVPAETAEAFLARTDVQAATHGLADALRDGAQLGRDFSEFSTRLDRGYGADDPAVAAALRWRTHGLMPELRSLARVQARLDVATQLEQLGSENRVAELTSAARAPTLGLALAAWSRLGGVDAWSVAANLDTELDLAAGLRRQIDRAVSDEPRRAELREQVLSGGRERWHRALRVAGDEKSVGDVLARQEKFGVRDEELAASERFNVELFRLKRANWAPLPPEEVIAARDQAVARLRELGGATLTTDLANRLTELTTVSLGGAKGEESDVRKLGPGTVGWQGELTPDGQGVDFVWPGHTPAQRLRFRLVASENTIPFFLATTELSAGLVVDLAATPAVRTKLRPWLITVIDDPTNDQRMGPRAWMMQKDGRLVLSSSWMPSRQPSWPRPEQAPFYPADVAEPAPPDRDAPMQYLPPAAAQYLARDLLGCRLPTREEWRGVLESRLAQNSSTAEDTNVRDKLWLRMRDYLVEQGVKDGEFPPDADVFWPRALGSRKTWRDAAPVAPERDDHAVWFARVASGDGDGFHHLFGNVAEYLFDPADSRFYVVGGSALSPPEIVPSEPYPVESALALAGFSDVGLRLAFNAPASVTGRNRLQLLIRNLPFLRS